MTAGISSRVSTNGSSRKRWAPSILCRTTKASPGTVLSGGWGLHFQKGEFAQAKLVRVVRGSVLDVAVDLREGSPTYGKWHAEELTGENHRMMFIPRGFAHGFSVLSEEVVFQYKCDNLYCPSSEGAIAWNDPTLAIDWRIPREAVILSEKDKHHPFLYEQ